MMNYIINGIYTLKNQFYRGYSFTLQSSLCCIFSKSGELSRGNVYWKQSSAFIASLSSI